MIVTDQKILRKMSTETDWPAIEILEKLKKEIPVDASGLAAIQIGIPARVFITRFKDELIEWINPIIEEFSMDKIESEEGCLSIPNKKVFVKRHKEITVSTQASETAKNRYVLLDEEAVIFQHEFDHLNGKLIVDRVAKRNEPCPCGKLKNGKPIKYKNCCGQ
jgi:peptide deformylase